ncbi:transmembrane protein 69 isoform X3 [Passer montanus]|nr:transmembrane protein 69 isoform X3 [Passer montanus]
MGAPEAATAGGSGPVPVGRAAPPAPDCTDILRSPRPPAAQFGCRSRLSLPAQQHRELRSQLPTFPRALRKQICFLSYNDAASTHLSK